MRKRYPHGEYVPLVWDGEPAGYYVSGHVTDAEFRAEIERWFEGSRNKPTIPTGAKIEHVHIISLRAKNDDWGNRAYEWHHCGPDRGRPMTYWERDQNGATDTSKEPEQGHTFLGCRNHIGEIIEFDQATWWGLVALATPAPLKIAFHVTCYLGASLPMVGDKVEVVFSDESCTRLLSVSPQGRSAQKGPMSNTPRNTADLSPSGIRDALCYQHADPATREIVLAMAERALEVIPDAGTPEATRYAVMQAIGSAAHEANQRYLDTLHCANNSPPGFTGHWRDWHRGHGCGKDDHKPRSTAGQAEIAALGGAR